MELRPYSGSCMIIFVCVAVALSLSWFGQLPPHGEFERDWLSFSLLFVVLLVVGLRAARSETAKLGLRVVARSPLVVFGALWAVLIAGVVGQSLVLPAEAWGGRNAIAVGWLVGALGCLGLGVAATYPWIDGRGDDFRPAWRGGAAGLAIAAVFNAAVAWLQILPPNPLQALLPMPPESGRGYGALFQPNLTALLLVLGIVSVTALVEDVPGMSWPKRLAGAMVLFLGSGVAVTGSRIGLAMLLVVLVWLLAQGRLRERGVAWLAGLGAAGFALALALATFQGAEFSGPLARGAAMSNGRAMIFANAWQMGLAFPVSGAGFGQMSYWHVELPYAPKMPGYLTHAHNLFLQFWAEMGVLGVLWLALALSALAWPLMRPTRPWQPGVSAGQRWALSVLVLILMHSMTELPLWSAPFLLLLAFAAGVWLAPGRGVVSPDRRCMTVSVGALAKVGVALGMVGLAASIWVYTDYLKVTVLFEGHRGAPVARVEALQKASRSTFFRPTAEFAAASTSAVTRETAPAFARTLPHLWRYVTDPRMFEWQLRTSAWQRDRVAYDHYAQRFAQLYPKEYAAFGRAIAMEKSASPWTEFPVD